MAAFCLNESLPFLTLLIDLPSPLYRVQGNSLAFTAGDDSPTMSDALLRFAGYHNFVHKSRPGDKKPSFSPQGKCDGSAKSYF